MKKIKDVKDLLRLDEKELYNLKHDYYNLLVAYKIHYNCSSATIYNYYNAIDEGRALSSDELDNFKYTLDIMNMYINKINEVRKMLIIIKNYEYLTDEELEAIKGEK